jgi:hypothetical protein
MKSKDQKVVSMFPSDDDILEGHMGYEGRRDLLVLAMDADGILSCSANTKGRILFLVEVFKLQLLDGGFDQP